jgi:hypothetical protein
MLSPEWKSGHRRGSRSKLVLDQVPCAILGGSRAMALIWIMCGDPSRPPTVQRVRAVGNDEIKAFEGQLDHGGIDPNEPPVLRFTRGWKIDGSFDQEFSDYYIRIHDSFADLSVLAAHQH